MTAASSTGTASRSSEPSEMCGNVFSEAMGLIGIALSEIVPEKVQRRGFSC